MKNERTQEIIDEYIVKIISLGYAYITGEFDCPARADTFLKMLIVNEEKLTIFAICHEYHHALSQHTGRLMAFNGNDSRNPNEHDCNYDALCDLMDRYHTLAIPFNNIDFMSWYSIPAEFESKVIEIYKANYSVDIEEVYYAQN